MKRTVTFTILGDDDDNEGTGVIRITNEDGDSEDFQATLKDRSGFLAGGISLILVDAFGDESVFDKR